MRDGEDVEEAKRLARRSDEDQWRLAELTWRSVKPKGDLTPGRWGGEIGCSVRHVRTLRRVWSVWGGDSSPQRPPFWDTYLKVQSGNATIAALRTHAMLARASPVRKTKIDITEADEAFLNGLGIKLEE